MSQRAATSPATGDALVKSGPNGIASLLVSERVRTRGDVRRLLANGVVSNKSALPIARHLMEDGKRKLADAMIEAGAEADRRATTMDEQHRFRDRIYAAWLIANNRLGERLSQLHRLPDPSPAALRQIAVLCLANGDFQRALDCAERIPADDLVLEARYGLGAWDALAAAPDGRSELERLGHATAYARLAGNRKALELAVQGMHAYADHHMAEARKRMMEHPANGEDWDTVKMLLVNDRPQDACGVLTRARNYVQLTEVLRAMERYEEALAVIQRGKDENDPWVRSLRGLELEILCTVGETAQARAAVASFLEERTPSTDDRTVAAMVEAATQVGLTAEAATLAASVLDRLPPERATEQNVVLRALLDHYGDVFATRWLPILRKAYAGNSTATNLLFLRGVRVREKAALVRFVLLTERLPVLTSQLSEPEQINLWEDQANAHTELGNLAGAIGCWRRACGLVSQDNLPGREWLYKGLASALIADSQWSQAAVAARQAFEVRRRAAFLWVEGWALAKNGQKRIGAETMEQARLLAAISRDEMDEIPELARWMDRLGAPELAARQNELVFRVAPPHLWDKRLCAKEAADLAWKAGDFAKAAALGEAFRFSHLTSNMAYGLTPYGYLAVMWQIHAAAALKAADAGNFDAMMEHVRLAREAQPADVELAIMLVPNLEKAGQHELADRVFSKAYEFNDAVVRRFPRCIASHGALAWLSACTGRGLSESLDHGRLAIDLAPDNHFYRSVFADILFRLDRRDEALAEMRRCVEQAPGVEHYQRALLRMLRDTAVWSQPSKIKFTPPSGDSL
ncbi:MAG: hypothetical protein WCS01_06555 [bacterium]